MAKIGQQKKRKTKLFPLIEPNAAGIDVGATEIYVAVPEDRAPQPVRKYETFTEDLHAAAKWLRECGITSVAMESTGVYWIPVFQILESYGFTVILVNARHVKNVPGRKTDVMDCQWLQYLHAVGLLRGSYRPGQAVCAVRSLLRHRDNMVSMASTHVQHMQKSLTQMNLHLHHVISNIVGVTGLAIVEAILAGERDPVKLAALKDRRIKADASTIAKSLVGDYRDEHLFTLGQALEIYRHYRKQIVACDVRIEEYLRHFESRMDPVENPLSVATSTHKQPQGNEPDFDLRLHLHRIIGVDLTRIDGISTTTAQVYLSEVGPDVGKFPTAGCFASWLGLCPNNKISGGKILSSRTRPGAGRLAQALRMAAQGVHNSHSYLGEYLRRMKARHGAPKALTATAHKLARIIYHLVKTGQHFDESVFAKQEDLHKKRLEHRIRNQAKSIGFMLVACDCSSGE